jgi:hypothetical protein
MKYIDIFPKSRGYPLDFIKPERYTPSNKTSAKGDNNVSRAYNFFSGFGFHAT